MRVYKDIPQGILIITFWNFTSACACSHADGYSRA